MTAAERIQVLRRHGFENTVVAALLGVTEAEVAAHVADPSVEVSLPGGSAPAPLKQVASGSYAAVADASYTPLAWSDLFGDDLLDVTDPAAPFVKVAGLYVITANALAQIANAGKFAYLALEIDADNDDVTFFQSGQLDGGGGVNPKLTLTASYVLDAGAILLAAIRHNVGANDNWKLNAVLTCIPTS